MQEPDNRIKTKILVCVHKPDFFLNDDLYQPIHVGKALSKADLGLPGDDTGDNISDKNREFCELTAHYWAWKNLRGVDYVGLSHYRRYLDFNDPLSPVLIKAMRPENVKAPQIDIQKEFSRCDIIVSNYDCHPVSNKIHYCYCHQIEDYAILRTVIEDIYPDYLKSFDRIMIRKNKVSIGNMFVASWKTFDQYSEWLFKILFETEKRVRLSPYDYQRRVFGFMAERLLDVYCYHNQLRMKRVPVIFVSDNKPRSAWAYLFKRAKRTFMFWFSAKRTM